MPIVLLLPTTCQFCFNSEAANLYEAIAYRVRLTDAGFEEACVALVAASKAKALAKR